MADFLKGPDSKYFRLVGTYISVAVTRHCHGNGKAEMNGYVCVPVKLYSKIGGQPADHSLSTPDLDNQQNSKSSLDLVFVDFHGVNTPTMTTFKLTYQWDVTEVRVVSVFYYIYILYLHFHHTDTVDIHNLKE